MISFFVDKNYIDAHTNQLLEMVYKSFVEYYQNTKIKVKAPIILGAHLLELFAKKEEFVRVWEYNGSIIAFAWFGVDYSIFTEPYSTVRMFYIKPEYRNKHLAVKILFQMLDTKNMPDDLLKYPHCFEVVSHNGISTIPTGKRWKGILLSSKYYRDAVQ